MIYASYSLAPCIHSQNTNAKTQSTPARQNNTDEAILARPNMFAELFRWQKTFLKKKVSRGNNLNLNQSFFVTVVQTPIRALKKLSSSNENSISTRTCDRLMSPP